MEGKKLNRNLLIELFKNGKKPTENDFKSLIDSTLNKVDDGINLDSNNGLELTPTISGGRVISLYNSNSAEEPIWNFSVGEGKNGKELKINSIKGDGLTIVDKGFLGVNKIPDYALDVNGSIAMKTRVGIYASGTVPADGNWHTLLDNLEGCTMFELTACAKGEKKQGKYAFLYAILINTYNGSEGSIKSYQNYYKWWHFWKRIKLRWVGTPFNYKLQIKTSTNYIKGGIEYQVMKLHK